MNGSTETPQDEGTASIVYSTTEHTSESVIFSPSDSAEQANIMKQLANLAQNTSL